MGPQLEIILRKQFDIAGHLDKFDNVDFKSDTWFQDLTWTNDQEMEFKRWITDYLSSNIAARREVMVAPTLKSKKHLYRWFNWWNLCYGFKIKED